MTADPGFEVTLSLPVDAAIERVTEALKLEGFGVLTRIDVQETLQKKLGVAFRPYVILGACNPGLAHQALSDRAEVGLMLPCNVTVESTGEGSSIVRIADPAMMMTMGDLGSSAILQEVGAEARVRLARVAGSLRST
jgi:uncharacterized protein (DUF302 family)